MLPPFFLWVNQLAKNRKKIRKKANLIYSLEGAYPREEKKRKGRERKLTMIGPNGYLHLNLTRKRSTKLNDYIPSKRGREII